MSMVHSLLLQPCESSVAVKKKKKKLDRKKKKGFDDYWCWLSNLILSIRHRYCDYLCHFCGCLLLLLFLNWFFFFFWVSCMILWNTGEVAKSKFVILAFLWLAAYFNTIKDNILWFKVLLIPQKQLYFLSSVMFLLQDLLLENHFFESFPLKM